MVYRSGLCSLLLPACLLVPMPLSSVRPAPAPPIAPLSAAAMLLGRQLENGWRVVQKCEQAPDATGGLFSTCYLVEHADSQKAFLKALDFSKAGLSEDPAREMQLLT